MKLYQTSVLVGVLIGGESKPPRKQTEYEQHERIEHKV